MEAFDLENDDPRALSPRVIVFFAKFLPMRQSDDMMP